MDPPLSEDEDEESLYSSSMSMTPQERLQSEEQNEDVAKSQASAKIFVDSNPLSAASSASGSIATSKEHEKKAAKAVLTPHGGSNVLASVATSETHDSHEHHDEEDVPKSDVPITDNAVGTASSVNMTPDQTDSAKGTDAAAKIKDEEEFKMKVPLSTSLMLSRVDHNTNDILHKLSNPKVEKLTIRFQPIGSIEQIQPKVFKISSTQQFQTLVMFLNKKLGKNLQKKQMNQIHGGHIFCYLQNSFSPGPEETIGNLFEHFAVNNELTVSYCDTMAFR